MKYINSIKKNTIFLLLVLSIILYFVLKDDFNSIVNIISKMKIGWLLIAILLIFIYWLIRSICLYDIAKKHSNKIKFSQMFLITLITQFFNGITPFSTGGQPMEVYYLSKCGIKTTKGTNIILQNFVMYQTALIMYGIIAITINYKFHFFKRVPILRELTTLGFIINILVGLALLLISFSSKFNKKTVLMIIKLLHKMKIVKDIDKTKETWLIRLDEFHDSAKLFKKHKGLFLKGFMYHFLSLGIFYAIPLFIILGLGQGNINLIETITASAYVLIIGSFVPIPGGSGGIEYGFIQFFGNFISGAALSASLLIWRFITYYLGIILGAVSINFFKGSEKE